MHYVTRLFSAVWPGRAALRPNAIRQLKNWIRNVVCSKAARHFSDIADAEMSLFSQKWKEDNHGYLHSLDGRHPAADEDGQQINDDGEVERDLRVDGRSQRERHVVAERSVARTVVERVDVIDECLVTEMSRDSVFFSPATTLHIYATTKVQKRVVISNVGFIQN